jgi:hypothetical protein
VADFTIKSGDTGPALPVTLYDGEAPLLLTGATVAMRMQPLGGGPIKVDKPATVVDALAGSVEYQWEAEDTDEPGEYEVEFVVTYAGGNTQTFPNDGYIAVEITPALSLPDNLSVPALPDSCWPVDEGCCSDFDTYPPQVQARAKALATQTLRALTGYRVGGCPITLTLERPCQYTHGHAIGLVPFTPTVTSTGAWVNNGCPCGTLNEVTLPGPIGRVDEVVVDGVALDTDAYVVRDGERLVRVDGEKWPAERDKITVTYLRAIPVDGLGAYAAGILACEYAKACSGAKGCRLPSGVTEITRQGVTMTITSGAFPDGKTGIREVDAFVMRWNPNGLKSAPTVWTPDRRANITTWQA